MPDVGTAVEDSRALVALWFPEARAAWLGGSVILGQDTPGSDLDVTVLLAGPPAPFRDSRRYRGWPVELFVHTETSLDFYVRRDARSGRPTMPRLVGRSEVLVDTHGSGRQWQATARALLSAGPPRLAGDDLASLRYAVTDAMDDVTHAHDAHERLVTATMLADEAALAEAKVADRSSARALSKSIEELASLASYERPAAVAERALQHSGLLQKVLAAPDRAEGLAAIRGLLHSL